jgi:carboxyl-terminal processing protease
VYDGGGIDPDVKTKPMEAHPLTQVLFEKGFIFDYATIYASKRTDPVDSKTFTLSNDEYQQFVQWMSGKNYEYKSLVEFQLEQFTEEAKKERYYQDIKAQLDQVVSRIASSKENELMLYKDQIKMLLEEEIVSRYHLERGSIEARFKYDTDVREAITILHDPARYHKILNHQ